MWDTFMIKPNSQIFSNNSVMSTDKPSPLLAIKTSFDVAACHLFYA